MSDKQVLVQHMRGFKLAAVQLARSGQAISDVAKIWGMPKASLSR